MKLSREPVFVKASGAQVSIPWIPSNRFQGSLNVYKFGLRPRLARNWQKGKILSLENSGKFSPNPTVDDDICLLIFYSF
jgi:hypothetical protein